MDRRAFLAVVATAVAGCGQGSDADADPGTGTSRSTETPTATPTATGTPEPADLRVTDLSVPSTIEIGTAVTLSLTVANRGGRSGAFAAPIEAKLGTGEWEATDRTAEATVPPGESVTEEYELGPHPYVEPASYRVADAEPVARTRFVARELAVGEAHTLPNGVAVSVESVAFDDTYTYEGEDGETTLEPTDGEKWAVATVRAENAGDEPAAAPLVSDVAFFRGEEEYAYQHVSDNRDRYRGGELAPGEVSEGDLPSDVPREAGRADLRIDYGETLDGGEVAVSWSLDA